MLNEFELVARLLLAALLGGIIGLQREGVNKSAGFRTHTLVAVGSCLIMIVSISIHLDFQGSVNADPARLAAQVVSGIGFLGAGAIIRSGVNVKGLTTAATLWVVAGLGLAVGAGNYLAAFVTTLIIYTSLVYFFKVEKEIIQKKKMLHNLNLLIEDRPGQIGLICSTLGNNEISIKNIQLIKEKEEKATVQLELLIKIPSNIDIQKVVTFMQSLEGIHKVTICG